MDINQLNLNLGLVVSVIETISPEVILLELYINLPPFAVLTTLLKWIFLLLLLFINAYALILLIRITANERQYNIFRRNVRFLL